MNPNAELPGLNLPEPVGASHESAPTVVAGEVGSAKPEALPTHERAPASQAPLVPVADPAQATSQTTVVDATAATPRDSGAGTTQGGSENLHFSEAEVIQKAKAIIEETRDDPYRQTGAIAKLKTDYLRSRYNKVLTGEE